MKRMSLVSVALIATVPMIGCDADSLSGPQPEGEHPAYLQFFGDGPRFDVPLQGTAGETVQLAIQTFGGGCVQKGRTEVSVEAEQVLVRPFDVFPSPDAYCTADLRLIDHTVSIRLPTEGSYTVTVSGMRVDANPRGGSRRESVSFERQILVRSTS